MATRWLIGIGNTLRGDDAFGPLVAEHFQTQLLNAGGNEEVHVVSVMTLTPEMAADLAGADRVVFVDVAMTGEPGVVQAGQLLHAPSEKRGQAITPPIAQRLAMRHGLDPDSIWGLARQLFGARGEAWVVTTRGLSFELVERELSPPVAGAVAPVVEKVLEILGVLQPFANRSHRT